MNKHFAAVVALLFTPVAVVSGCAQTGNSPSESSTSGSAAGTQKLSAPMNTADGRHGADATVDFADGYATVTVQTVATGILSPGFHSLGIHEIGACDATSVAPNGGPTGDFASAGDRLQAPGHTAQPASGDLPP